MSDAKLYIVPTPIGNLGDITFRALEVLKLVDVVLSEDTRETDKLFKKFGIEKPQRSYRDQNHTYMIEQIKDMLNNGNSLALVSDSGTPLISDPGFKLIRDLSRDGYKIEALPGPSAVTTALSVSGLPSDKFLFLGFLPKTQIQKQNFFLKYKELDATIIFYESPFRLVKSLEALQPVFGEREVCICNDLTKMYEDIFRGKLSSAVDYYKQKKIKGEFVVLVAKEDYQNG